MSTQRYIIRDYRSQITRNMLHDVQERIQAGPVEVLVRNVRQTRSLEQNALLWELLGQVSDKVVWHGVKLSPDDWKDMFTAALKRSRVVPGLDGGFVVLGLRTSKMSVQEMSDLIELINAFMAERGL